MMKGAAKFKTILVIIILLLVGVLGVVGVGAVRTYMSGAEGALGPKTVSAIIGSDGKSATISFSTDKKTRPTVMYGTSPTSMLLSKVAAEESTEFNVSLSPLKDNTQYYYAIKIADTIYDNAGIPYSFSTKAKSTGVTEEVSPTAIPTVATTTKAECNRDTDYNFDGVVNTVDYIDCTSGKTKSSPAPSCSGTDYNNDGTINAVDEILCRSKK
jgi:hypothetical protein